MDYIINGFLACIGALAALGVWAVTWFIWPYIVIVFLRFVTTKKWQAKMVDDLKNDLKNDRGWNAPQNLQKRGILQILRAVRWNENKE